MNFKACSAVVSAFAMSLMLAACGSDDNSSNVERDEGSSSSVEESSSSVEESSSSAAPELPKGLRAATLDDLEKNMTLGEKFGTQIYLAAGAKQGEFSIWIPDTAWIAVRSNFENGIIEFGPKNGSYMGIDSKASDSMKEFFEATGKLQFVVKDEKKLQVSINDGDYIDVEKANVQISSNWISDGTQLQGVKLSCKNGDTKQDYSFYKGRYIVEETVKDKSSWSAGYYDIERSHLLMLPVFFNEAVFSMVSAQVSSDFDINMDTGESYKCEKSTFKFKDVDQEALAGEWIAPEKGLDWTLTLKKSGDYSVVAKKGANTEELKSGIWDVYGDVLLLKNSSCLHPSECASAVRGSIEGFDSKKGFTFNHDDSDTPAVPTTWTVPQYE
jgi:hypothetical protein